MVFFMETKIYDKRMEGIRRRCGFVNGIDIGAEGTRGGLCLAWKEDFMISLKTFSRNHIDVLIEECNVSGVWRFTGFYGSPYANNQNDSWNLLKTLGQGQRYLWMVCGNFNEIMYSFEKKEGQPREKKKMAAFCKVLEECQLLDLGFQGRCFTWERGNLPETNIRERLDRGVVNGKWLHLFSNGFVRHLTHTISDHCPLLIHTTNEDQFKRSRRFKFEAWWTLEENFEQEVKMEWESSDELIYEKLERLQSRLMRWAIAIKQGRNGLKKKLNTELESLLESERDDDTRARLIDTRIRLNMEIDKDERYWEQRARANWLQLGDKNTAFFHKYATTHKRINTISRLESVEGQEITDEGGIYETTTNYFQNLFSSNVMGDSPYLLEGITPHISKDINTVLLSTYTVEEVYQALKGMGPTKALGWDGFPALFFQKYWHIIGKDVEEVCLGILNEGKDFESSNYTDIVLIPKIPNPTNLINFRPISLCTVLYKIVAKTIANRLQNFIRRCIDSAQSAFVPGRLISDNVLIAYELLHKLRQKRYGRKGLMAAKLDMSKAYDRVEWGFLKDVLLKMGFAEEWVRLVMKCVSTVSYAVNINGNRGRNFKPTRGLRRGDPLSPYLFLICGEGLSTLIRLAIREGVLKGVKASRRGPAVSHLLFADDCIVFGEATKERARFLKEILKSYEQCSGQCVNFNKSTIFFSTNTSEEMKKEIEEVLGMRSATNLEKYLGLPNIVGKRKKESFQNIKDKVTQRLGQWSTRFLSKGGKEIFIKSVLQAIPNYAINCFLLPKSFCEELEAIFAKFWWQHGKKKKGIHWCQWKVMCRSKEEGGMGFRDMSQFNISLLAKQGCRIISNEESLVAHVLKAKYFSNTHFLNASLGNNCSYTWKSIWAASDVLKKGLLWRVGTGNSVSINQDAWIPDATNFRLSAVVNSMQDLNVNALIDTGRKWKKELIKNTFPEEDSARILRISLAENPHEDFLVWGGEASGEYSARSAYKLLQIAEENPRAYAVQTVYRKFYKKLWLLNLPTKLKITIWRISWNYLPTKVNMQHRRLVTYTSCRRCGEQAETINHLFRECPVIKEIWSELHLQIVLTEEDKDFKQWLIWVFEMLNTRSCRVFSCALWAIWGDRNSRVH
ncbi:reverse transcriptase [Gossypium australe]|uniref:Reverse transcriptase n=1 Tax=Gossypium australe TaxID=47621 RepID=A0A5B6UMS8_9ROSI|nr:reverse transcriptase [Gossypium australe]